MSNQWCHICGGLVDHIGLQPQDVRLCACGGKIAKLRVRIAELEAELAAARVNDERYRWLRDMYTVTLLDGRREMRITNGPRGADSTGIDAAIDAARGAVSKRFQEKPKEPTNGPI